MLEILIFISRIKISAKYITKINKSNYIYYDCSKRRNGCRGSIIYDKKENKFYTNRECSDNIKHDTCTFVDYDNKKLHNYNMNYDKIQKYYIRSLYKSKNVLIYNSF